MDDARRRLRPLTGVPSWQQDFGGPAADYGSSVAFDASDNVYVVRAFAGSTSTGLVSDGGRDVFLAKYDPLGNLLWSKGWGSPLDDAGLDVKTAGPSDVFISGTFSGTIDPLRHILVSGDFSGKLELGVGVTAASIGGSDAFVGKLDRNGNAIWLETAGVANAFETAHGCSAGSKSNVSFTGYFTPGFELLSPPLVAQGSEDAFVAELSP